MSTKHPPTKHHIEDQCDDEESPRPPARTKPEGVFYPDSYSMEHENLRQESTAEKKNETATLTVAPYRGSHRPLPVREKDFQQVNLRIESGASPLGGTKKDEEHQAQLAPLENNEGELLDGTILKQARNKHNTKEQERLHVPTSDLNADLSRLSRSSEYGGRGGSSMSAPPPNFLQERGDILGREKTAAVVRGNSSRHSTLGHSIAKVVHPFCSCPLLDGHDVVSTAGTKDGKNEKENPRTISPPATTSSNPGKDEKRSSSPLPLQLVAVQEIRSTPLSSDRGEYAQEQQHSPILDPERVVAPRRRGNRRPFPVVTRPGVVRVGGQADAGADDGTIVIGGDTIFEPPDANATPRTMEPLHASLVEEPRQRDKEDCSVGQWAVGLLLLLLSVAGLAVGLGLGLSRDSENHNVEETLSPTPDPIRTKWVMVGQPDDIVGGHTGEWLGSFVAISGDGNTIAAAALDFQALQPYIITLSVAANSTTQLGNRIYEPSGTNGFGWGVSLSHSGDLLATASIGGNFVYRLSGLISSQIWIEHGPRFGSGYETVLSSDGSTAVVGDVMVRAHQYDNENNVWSAVGQLLWGEEPSDLFGWSKSLSANGNRMAVSLPGSSSSTGSVRVFDLLEEEGGGGAHYWNQTGLDIVGIAELDVFGLALSLSGDARCVAVGAVQNYDFNVFDFTTSSRPGYVQVYCQNDSRIWVQLGQTLYGNTVAYVGEPVGSLFGWSVDLSGNGHTLIVGAPRANFPGGGGYSQSQSGQVSIFNYEDDSKLWIQVARFDNMGEHIYGCGHSVSVSSNGDVAVVGCPASDPSRSGVVRVVRAVPCEEDEDGRDSLDNVTPCRGRG